MRLTHRSRRLLMVVTLLLAQLAGTLWLLRPNRRGGATDGDGSHERRREAGDGCVPAGEKQSPLPGHPDPHSLRQGRWQQGLAGNLCPQGYAVVVQDMRGRFASEGHHAIIFGNDGLGGQHRDGHDTIRWITKQPWSDGKVATWGGSALGIVQNMTAPDAPECSRARS